MELHQRRKADAALAVPTDVLREAACEIAALVSCNALQERDSDSNMARAFGES
jgi:hypothetical protein